MSPRPRPLADRFWAKVDKAGPTAAGLGVCWLWARGLSADGYGMCFIRRGASGQRAHRVAWELCRGPIPEGLLVLHRCDNRRCVNPDHLFIGTHLDNMRDMYAKGRGPTGERSGPRKHPERMPRGERVSLAKLTEADVVAIRLSRESGPVLARRYSVRRCTINKARAGDTWAHVPRAKEDASC